MNKHLRYILNDFIKANTDPRYQTIYYVFEYNGFFKDINERLLSKIQYHHLKDMFITKDIFLPILADDVLTTAINNYNLMKINNNIIQPLLDNNMNYITIDDNNYIDNQRYTKSNKTDIDINIQRDTNKDTSTKSNKVIKNTMDNINKTDIDYDIIKKDNTKLNIVEEINMEPDIMIDHISDEVWERIYNKDGIIKCNRMGISLKDLLNRILNLDVNNRNSIYKLSLKRCGIQDITKIIDMIDVLPNLNTIDISDNMIDINMKDILIKLLMKTNKSRSMIDIRGNGICNEELILSDKSFNGYYNRIIFLKDISTYKPDSILIKTILQTHKLYDCNN
jgi:hypothetical protein